MVTSDLHPSFLCGDLDTWIVKYVLKFFAVSDESRLNEMTNTQDVSWEKND